MSVRSRPNTVLRNVLRCVDCLKGGFTPTATHLKLAELNWKSSQPMARYPCFVSIAAAAAMIALAGCASIDRPVLSHFELTDSGWNMTARTAANYAPDSESAEKARLGGSSNTPRPTGARGLRWSRVAGPRSLRVTLFKPAFPSLWGRSPTPGPASASRRCSR